MLGKKSNHEVAKGTKRAFGQIGTEGTENTESTERKKMLFILLL